jgi:hypothetical protein
MSRREQIDLDESITMDKHIARNNLLFVTSSLTNNFFESTLDLVANSGMIVGIMLIFMLVMFVFKDTGTDSGITTIVVLFMSVLTEFVSNDAFLEEKYN